MVLRNGLRHIFPLFGDAGWPWYNLRSSGVVRFRVGHQFVWHRSRWYNAYMDAQPKQILDVALTLPESDRAGLAASLIRSLDDAPDPDSDAKWATEIERRIRSIEEGSAELEAWDAVMAKMHDRHNG